MKQIANTRVVSAAELRINDIILKSDTGEFDSIVEDTFTDDYGTWLDDGSSAGYLPSYMQFRIEWL